MKDYATADDLPQAPMETPAEVVKQIEKASEWIDTALHGGDRRKEDALCVCEHAMHDGPCQHGWATDVRGCDCKTPTQSKLSARLSQVRQYAQRLQCTLDGFTGDKTRHVVIVCLSSKDARVSAQAGTPGTAIEPVIRIDCPSVDFLGKPVVDGGVVSFSKMLDEQSWTSAAACVDGKDAISAMWKAEAARRTEAANHITEAELAEAERLAVEATEGPWDFEDSDDACCGRPCTPNGCHESHPSGWCAMVGPQENEDQPGYYRKPDAEMMARSRELMPKLAREVRRLQRRERDNLAAAGRQLVQADVDQLPDGAMVLVKWSGGNGPHPYIVRVDRFGGRWTATTHMPTRETNVGRLDMVGRHPLTEVWLVWSPFPLT